MIVPHPKKRDWFRIDPEDAPPLFGMPGLKIEGSRFIAHRNLLSTMEGHPAVAKLLAVPQPSRDAWDTKRAWCAERGFVPRVTQLQGLDFVNPRRGTLVGDDMRTGKTVLALLAHDPARGQLMIVAPLIARGVWLGWARRVFPELADQIGVFTTRKFDAIKAKKPIVFANYDILTHWQSLDHIGTLIFDEAHMLGNKDSKRTAAAAGFAAWADKVIALTGTPVWNMPPDLWSLLTLLTDGWGSYYDFCNRYGDPQPTAYGNTYAGISNAPELQTRMREVMIRRRWIDVSDDVPPITRSVVVADLDQAARNRLDIMAAALQGERANTAGNLAAYRKQVTKVKLPTVKAEIAKITGRNEPVVVWTWHRDNAKAIAEAVGGFVIHGEIAADERDRRIEAWRQTSNGVLVGTLSVGQVAIDLSHARIALFAEIDYTPAIIAQGEMRTFSPLRGMDVIFIVANHIVDQRIVRALISKLSAADPLGLAAATDAIDALRDAILGPQDSGDLDRLLEDFLASA